MLVNGILKQNEIRAMLEEMVRLGAQSSAIPLTAYETVPPSRRRTRMTPIGRIFTDPCASAFICIHPRLIFNREMRGVSAI